MPGRVLVSVDGLAEELSSGTPPALLDVRWRLAGPPGRDDYVAGHVPGAVFVDLDVSLAEPVRDDRRGGRHPLPDPARFGAAMRSAGVRPDRPVVVYDDRDGTSAARCWWLLVHHGHEDVRVLDGGIAAWVAAGHPLEPGEVSPAPGDWTPVVPGRLAVVDAEAAAAVARDGLLLDARVPERYRGDREPVDPVAGHVPGAVNAPAAGWLDDTGHLRSPEAIRRRLDELGARAEAPVATYCGSGVVATQTVLALASAGIDAALYPGSWSDWVSDPSRPVATGDES